MIVNKKKDQKGSALVYILIAIALLAALTATFMDSSSQQTTAQNSFNAVSDLSAQANLIRSAIQECVQLYPGGDNGLINTGITLNHPYPINPTSTYLSSPDANNEVRNIRCPGNPGTSNDHADIFSGSSGKFLPNPPNLFDPWIYASTKDGVFIYTKTNKTDSFIQTALSKLDDQFSECEADVMNASAAQVEMLSSPVAADPKCPVNHYCFRLWITAKPSNVYNGDSEGDEADTDGVPGAPLVPCP